MLSRGATWPDEWGLFRKNKRFESGCPRPVQCGIFTGTIPPPHFSLDTLESIDYIMTKRQTIRMKLRKLREARGWTQEQLAGKAGLHRVSITQIEIGRRKNPDLDTRKKLAKALGVEITELLD